MRLLTASCILSLSFAAASLPAAESIPRSAADAKRDVGSRPFEVLDFFGVEPGWKVIDLFAGNGYYSEALAQRVGPGGKVYLHNNQAYMAFADKLNERVANDRLPNVEVYIREIDGIDLPPGSLDMAILVKAYHDVYFVQDGWNVTADPLFAAIHRILKPGGVLAIIDHHGHSGSGKAAAQNEHRIDAEFAKSDITARGFTFVGASDILRNPDDDLSKSVFDPAVRGQTSRFVFKFVRQ
jgi:predicted methyltransferase